MQTFENSTIQIGKFIFTKLELVEWNYSKYSKTWHRKYGGIKEVSERRVKIEKIDKRAKGGKKLLAIVNFDAWRGNILLSAIKLSGLFPAPKSKANLAIRLDKQYDAAVTRQIGNIKIWKRTLLGEVVDYCAVLNNITYHDKSPKLAISGLNKKLKAVVTKKNHPITYKLCRDLGFCNIGINQFCEAFNLDIEGSYSPDYINDLIKNNIDAKPFSLELETVGRVLNYKFSI